MHQTPEIIARAKAMYEAMIAKDPSPENVAKAEAILRENVGKANYEKIKSGEMIAQDMESPAASADHIAIDITQDQDDQEVDVAGAVDSQAE